MADPTIVTPPPPLSTQYWLKTDEPKPKYLRLHGDGINSVVLTEGAPPKFLRWEHVAPETEGDKGKEVAISWKNPGRSWGLVLQPPRAKYGWEEVQIVENEGHGGFVWVQEEGKQLLKWKGVVKGEGEVQAEWQGWIVCQWVQ